MATRLNVSTQDEAHTFVGDLIEGKEGKIKVMICRKWDVRTAFGKYISTDFIVSDEKGSIIHCTANRNIAHYFLKLKEGSIYFLKKFSFQPVKNEYRILKHNTHMLELDGSTIAAKTECSPDGFIRYPFELIEFESLRPTNNKYLVDAIGCVTEVGVQVPRTKTSSTVDFHLINERGKRLRVTLWNKLGDILLEKNAQHPIPFVVILSSMNVKEYNNELYLSSTSSTIIFDDATIPIIKEFQSQIQGINMIELQATEAKKQIVEGTLLNLLEWSRPQKRGEKNPSTIFNCKVEITTIRTKEGWYYFVCNSGKCKKTLSHLDGNFWCESCEEVIDYPTIGFRVHMNVQDASASVVVTMFDETVEKLVNRKAADLLQELDEDMILPGALRNLVNKSYILQVKSHTYFCPTAHGHESFTCAAIWPASAKSALEEHIIEDSDQQPLKRLRKGTSNSMKEATPKDTKQECSEIQTNPTGADPKDT